MDFIDDDGDLEKATLTQEVKVAKPLLDKRKLTKESLKGLAAIACSVIAALISNHVLSGSKTASATTPAGAAIEVSGPGTHDSTFTKNIIEEYGSNAIRVSGGAHDNTFDSNNIR